MTPQTCRQCGRPITNADYFVAGIEADPRGFPVNVYVHPACRSAYAAALNHAAAAAAQAEQFNLWSAQP